MAALRASSGPVPMTGRSPGRRRCPRHGSVQSRRGSNCAIQGAHGLAEVGGGVWPGPAGSGLTGHLPRRAAPDRAIQRTPISARADSEPNASTTAAGLPADEEASMFSLLIGYEYRSAAIDFGAPARRDPDAVSLVAELRGQPGTRVPHAWLTLDGQRVSTLDLLGPGFTLLTGRGGARWQAAASRACTRWASQSSCIRSPTLLGSTPPVSPPKGRC